jgi:hypothetical protein
VDWRSVVRRLQHNYGVTKRASSENDKSKLNEISEQYRIGRVRVPCKVIATAVRKKSADYFHPGLYVASFVYEVFLTLNLALPGSCDFYKSTITSNFKRFPWEVELSNYWFELSYLDNHKNIWPASAQLPLVVVRDWLQQVRIGLTQVPNNQMEKVLFALWHISVSAVSPAAVIWLFYGLETLFDTKAGENIWALQKRISELLSATGTEEKTLRKKLRALYDLRSSFVHGGLEVIHPLHNELLDRRVDEKYCQLANACEFGFAVMLRSLQEVITRKWYTVRYREEIIAGEAPVGLVS